MRQEPGGAPDVDSATKALGNGIGNRRVGVTEYLNQIVIVIVEKRQEKSADRVIAEVGGDIANANPPLGRGIVGVFGVRLEMVCVAVIPLTMRVKDCGRVVGGMIMEGVDPVAVDGSMVWLECESAIVRGDGLVELRLFPQDIAQIVEGIGEVGLDLKGLVVFGRGVGEFGLLAEDEAERVVDFGEIGIELDCAAEGGGRLD